MKDHRSAQTQILNALQYAFKTGDRGIVLVVLTGYTQFLYEKRELERAVQLGSLVESHYATWRETRDQAADLLAALKKSMTAEEFEEARRKGHALDLWETVGNLIAWQKPLEKSWPPAR
jgi:hypothetical protein